MPEAVVSMARDFRGVESTVLQTVALCGAAHGSRLVASAAMFELRRRGALDLVGEVIKHVADESDKAFYSEYLCHL